MKLDKQRSHQIVHQEIALDAYLNTLLEGVASEALGQPQESHDSYKQQNPAATDIKLTQLLQGADKELKAPGVLQKDLIAAKPIKPYE